MCKKFLFALFWIGFGVQWASASTFGLAAAGEHEITRFLVRLTLSTHGYATFCTGTLISNTEVLTAGHCLADPVTKALSEGQIFAEFKNEAGELRRVQIVKANSKFAGNIDLGVAFLGESAGFVHSEFPAVASAPCSKRGYLFPFGFGLDEKGKLPESARMTVYREAEGNDEFLAGVSDSPQTGRNCFGDSGGPVVCEQYGRPVIASVNSLIGGDLVIWLKSFFKLIDRPQLCAQMNVFYGIRLHTQKALLTELLHK